MNFPQVRGWTKSVKIVMVSAAESPYNTAQDSFPLSLRVEQRQHFDSIGSLQQFNSYKEILINAFYVGLFGRLLIVTKMLGYGK